MEASGKNLDESYQTGTKNSNDTVYYGVHIPNDLALKDINVFTNKSEVLQLVKQHKKARFKAFNFYHEAADFALNGFENPNNNLQVDFSTKQTESNALYGEKPSPFKGPKPQDLIAFRKAIEMGEIEAVEKIIWKNPRFLISSGDTPCILQEGSRYNALHVASKTKNAAIAELILNVISSQEFILLLYGEDNTQNTLDRANMFVDLYLNTPDKGFNETPLHFASKFGAADVVQILVSYPQCDRSLLNKYGQTAAMIACSRADSNISPNIRKKIEQLLADTYYVPVLRAEDNSLPPTIGEAFSPSRPLVFNEHPSTPRLEIQAYAGPMDKKEAERFRKIWKTPPRLLNLNRSLSKETQSLDKLSTLKYKDPQKGLEILGKSLAQEFDVQWKEYWPFLDSFVDIASDEGLQMLENYLAEKINCIVEENSTSSLEVSSMDQSSKCSTISDLCQAFNACKIDNSGESSFDRLDISGGSKNEFSPFLCIEKACQVFANRISSWILNLNSNALLSTLTSEMKQLENVILSYSTDIRFGDVTFSCVHPRLASLIAFKLNNAFDSTKSKVGERLNALIDACAKSFDCFSSDDELSVIATPSSKGTSIKKQLLCLANHISTIFNGDQNPSNCDNLTEADCVKVWEASSSCTCILLTRRSKKRSSWQRNSLRKYGNNSNEVFVGKKLFQDNKNEVIISNEDCLLEENFYTPPSSPSILDDGNDGSDKEFYDADTSSAFNVYINGEKPSKTDSVVFNALKYANCDIDRNIYPNVYLWRHNIGLFSDEERSSWRSINNRGSEKSHCIHTSTPQKSANKSWLRVTGMNSPQKSLRSNVFSF